jgi:UTP--glucose-1-phosphate uridylyltransferase
LEEAGKLEILSKVRDVVPKGVSCVFIRQGEPLGLGHAVLCARPAVGDEPFFVHLPDDLIIGERGCLAEMVEQYERTGASSIAVEDVPREKTSSYGIVDVDAEGRLKQIVEKPAPDVAPSTLAVVGRYLLTPAIFDKLEMTGRGAGGEIQLTDAIADLLSSEPVYASRFTGRRFDCGNKLGYIQAMLAVAQQDPELRAALL